MQQKLWKYLVNREEHKSMQCQIGGDCRHGHGPQSVEVYDVLFKYTFDVDLVAKCQPRIVCQQESMVEMDQHNELSVKSQEVDNSIDHLQEVDKQVDHQWNKVNIQAVESLNNQGDQVNSLPVSRGQANDYPVGSMDSQPYPLEQAQLNTNIRLQPLVAPEPNKYDFMERQTFTFDSSLNERKVDSEPRPIRKRRISKHSKIVKLQKESVDFLHSRFQSRKQALKLAYCKPVIRIRELASPAPIPQQLTKFHDNQICEITVQNQQIVFQLENQKGEPVSVRQKQIERVNRRWLKQFYESYI